MIKAPSNIKNPVATLKGWCNEKGELLKAQKLTQEQCDEFNGVKAKPAKVEVVKEEAPKPKKKKTTKKKKKKSAKKSLFGSLVDKLKS